MYQAIEAISRAGVIQPLEPVQFDENEPLVILRLAKSQAAPTPAAQAIDWRTLAGSLKNSPSLNDDPLVIQQRMRREWD